MAYLKFVKNLKDFLARKKQEHRKQVLKVHLSPKAISDCQLVVDAINFAQKKRISLRDYLGVEIIVKYDETTEEEES